MHAYRPLDALTLALAACIATHPVLASPPNAGTSSGPTRQASEPIAYDHLSSEQTEPFLIYGEPPVRASYVDAAEEFNNVRDCLVESERDAAKPDLRHIDWNAPGSADGVTVCLFRIFASLGSIDAAASWAKSHGFRISVDQGYKQQTYINPDYRVRALHGIYRTSDNSRLLVSGDLLDRLFGWILPVYANRFSAHWSEEGDLVSVSYSPLRL